MSGFYISTHPACPVVFRLPRGGVSFCLAAALYFAGGHLLFGSAEPSIFPSRDWRLPRRRMKNLYKEKKTIRVKCRHVKCLLKF